MLVADILARPRVPRQVVLLGCRTGYTEPLPASGYGITHAFLTAGSEVVVASSRVLEDGLAARLSARLYAGEGELDLVASYRNALLAERQENPGSDWASLRIWIR